MKAWMIIAAIYVIVGICYFLLDVQRFRLSVSRFSIPDSGKFFLSAVLPSAIFISVFWPVCLIYRFIIGRPI